METPKKEPDILLLLLLVGGLWFFIFRYIIFKPAVVETPEEKQAKVEKETNDWYEDLSSLYCEYKIKEQLRNPSSYQKIGEFKTAVDDGNQKEILWKFRAENGFGGLNVGVAGCKINKKGKTFLPTLISQ